MRIFRATWRDRLFHDEWVTRTCGSLDRFRRAVDRYQRELRRKALRAGREMYAVPPAQYVRRLESEGRVWRGRR